MLKEKPNATTWLCGRNMAANREKQMASSTHLRGSPVVTKTTWSRKLLFNSAPHWAWPVCPIPPREKF